jgi:hypothetical protein
MTRRRMLCVACLSLLCTYSELGAPVFSMAAEPRLKLVVVVRKSSPLSDLSLRDLKRLYLGEYITDADGTKLMALNHPAQSPDRVGFDQVVLKMKPDQIGRFWLDRKIRGQPPAPRSVAPRELLRKLVAATPGAVTYLREGEVDLELKAVTIDGKRPDAADYPLQY